MSAFSIIGNSCGLIGCAGLLKTCVDVYHFYQNPDEQLGNFKPVEKTMAVWARVFHYLGCIALYAGLVGFGMALTALSPTLPFIEGVIQCSNILAGTAIGSSLSFGLALFYRELTTIDF